MSLGNLFPTYLTNVPFALSFFFPRFLLVHSHLFSSSFSSTETSTRTVSITVLSSKLSSSSPSLPADATRPASLTTTLSPQAEPFTMPSVLSSLPITAGQVSPPFLASSPDPAEVDSKIEDQIEADPSIIEALKSKERLFVLRVGEDIERIVNERK